MKSYRDYVYNTRKIYEFRIKLANTELTSELVSKIERVLEAYKVETITQPKSLPIQEDRDFPTLGACERSYIDVGIAYPTIPEQIRQLVIERALVDASCVIVHPKATVEYSESFENLETRNGETPILLDENLPCDETAQDLVGQKRVDGFMKNHVSTKMNFFADLTKANN